MSVRSIKFLSFNQGENKQFYSKECAADGRQTIRENSDMGSTEQNRVRSTQAYMD